MGAEDVVAVGGHAIKYRGRGVSEAIRILLAAQPRRSS